MFEFIIPKDDPNQALRMRRFLMAFASYLMWMLMTLYCHYLGFIRLSLEWILILVGIFIIINFGFYILFRTGLNTKFTDPSLTMTQMLTAGCGAMATIYFTDNIRGVMLLAILIPTLFGIFRFSLRQYAVYTILCIISYYFVILLLIKNHPETINLRIELLQLGVFALLLTWISVIGSYISRLRKKLSVTNRNLNNALATINELAIHDDLTLAYNRRFMYDELKRQRAQADRGISFFSIALFDLDHFKQVNDTYGHLKGDDILKHLIHTVSHEIREIDCLARYGGEEFIVILDNTDIKGAEEFAHRIRKTVEEIKFPGFPDSFRITISIGITAYNSPESAEEIITRADRALYKAKASGRNQVIIENIT